MLALMSSQTVQRRTPGIQRLPYEIMAYIIMELDIVEIFDFSRCAPHFRYLVQEENICKAVVTAKASHTIEAQDAQRDGSYSRALRRLAKRRHALSQASPYVVGMVGLADSYIYVRGMLCYVLEARPRRWLRILDLHSSADVELVINIPALVSTAVPRSSKSRKYRFKVLYHSNGITSCLFSFALPRTENWLLIFKAREQQIIETVLLDSTAKLFVRNNQNYLYYGTHSEDGPDGFRKWVISGFDIRNGCWLPSKVHLSNMVGYDIGSAVCFEIIDNYFYGLSNQIAFEIEEVDWTSYYYCFRFPLDDPHPRKIQVVERHNSWRRKHSEGPIDDRWGFLSLVKDEASGIIKIIESRKEWLAGRSGSRRTYYTKEVLFGDDRPQQADENSLEADEAASRDDNSTDNIEPTDKTNGMTPQQRSVHHVHPGDESSETAIFTRSKTFLCSYSSCCQTFLDLIDDTPTGESSPQCLRLRAGHRRLKPVEGVATGPPPSDDGLNIDNKIRQFYQPNEIYTWPRDKDPLEPDPGLENIYQLLNPPMHVGCVTAACDERSLIYASGEDPKGMKALIYLSFDPATRLAGMSHGGTRTGLGQLRGRRSREVIGAPAIRSETKLDMASNFFQKATVEGSTYEGTATLGNPQGQSLPHIPTSPPTGHQSRHALPNSEGDTGWASIERAMHYDMGGKYTFAFPSKPTY
ncbi:hypothetical protein F5X99DRAFT_377538 [Biscogniauxia marginata]|nr:hypothetical protein F5X99DRAFT_377538 [Biscogniauxia marginata]